MAFAYRVPAGRVAGVAGVTVTGWPFTVGWPILGVTALAVPPMVLAMVYGVIPVAFRFGAPR